MPAVLLPLALMMFLNRPQDTRRETLMDQIEKTVVLPRGARPIGKYGRNYAFAGGGKVVAVYAIPPMPRDVRAECMMVGESFKAQPCSREQIDALERSLALAISSQAAAGERRWFESPDGLPRVSDGGCSYIDVEYDVSLQRVVRAECHGVG